MVLSFFKDVLSQLAVYAIVLAGVGFAYGVGVLVYGHREGGPRAVLLGIALVAGWGGMWVGSNSWDAFRTHQYPAALLFYLASLLTTFAVVVGAVSVFGSDRTARKWFDFLINSM